LPAPRRDVPRRRAYVRRARRPHRRHQTHHPLGQPPPPLRRVRRDLLQGLAPPATVIDSPDTNDASSLQRNTATAAVSSGSCMRPSGMVERTQPSSDPAAPAARRSSPGLPPLPVGRTPSGHTALTRIPCCPSSIASVSVRRNTPARAADSAPKPGVPNNAAYEERLTIAPPRP